MKPEEREEIERLIDGVEKCAAQDAFSHLPKVVAAEAMLPLTKFARQQLNLRVDGEKFRENFKVSFEHHWSGSNYSLADIPEDSAELSRLVLECLTAVPDGRLEELEEQNQRMRSALIIAGSFIESHPQGNTDGVAGIIRHALKLRSEA